MLSPLAVPLVGAPDQLVGAQRPRICSVPTYVSSAGVEAVELAAHAGLVLDPWQAWLLGESLGERGDGSWSAFEVGLIVSRQNGKGSILEARELAGLFLFDEQLILHSAHEFKTAVEAFRRIHGLIDNTPDLRRRVSRVHRSTNEMGIELATGARLRFVARSSGSGRGFSGDCVILDEAYNLGDEAMEALLPTLSARPNPQVWYTSSAGRETSVQLGRVRARGVAGGDPSLAFFEWSAAAPVMDGPGVEPDDQGDPAVWARANPALGFRITLEYIARERVALGADGFARERLGVGTYPSDESDRWEVISRAAWDALVDLGSSALDPVAFAADVTPERSWASIGVAGRRSDGGLHAEVAAHEPGTGWVVGWLVERAAKWAPCVVVVDPGSPAGSLIPDLENAGIEVLQPGARDVAQACGQLYDAVTDTRVLRHLGQPELAAALGGAKRRDLGDAWAWARRGLQVDISPLVAVTLAAWGFTTQPPAPPPATARATPAGDERGLWRPTQRLQL